MADSLPTSMLDPKTPEEVEVTDRPREPVWDPTLGIEAGVDSEERPRHKLVAIGDSLTQGFQSGAVHNTDVSYPAIIAQELGSFSSFRYPTYFGFGGLPLNIEFLVRELEEEFGDKLDWWELSLALYRVRHFMDRVEDWWERGPGSRVPNTRGINHNLGVYGWDLRDALERTADVLEKEIEEPQDHLFRQLVENANQRAALRVLRAARDKSGKALTLFGAAAQLGAEGTVENPGQGDGVETLIVFLGANNALPSMLRLEAVWSGDGYDDLSQKSRYTVWRPSHFRAELERVAREVTKVRARHVIWGTVPHVTIAPITRGVGPKMAKGSRYFPFYTRPWIRPEDFDVKNDPHLTGQEARAIDSAIDQYNDAITQTVRDAREGGGTGISSTSRGCSTAWRPAATSKIPSPGPSGGASTTCRRSSGRSRRSRTPASSPPARRAARTGVCSRWTGYTRPPSVTASWPRSS